MRKPALPFVNWLAFHVFMALLVVADAVVMGLGVDAPEQQRNLLYVLEVILCLIFLCEICLRGFFFSSRVFSAVQGATREPALVRLRRSLGGLAHVFENVQEKAVNAIDVGAVLLSTLDLILAPSGRSTVLRFAVLLRLCRVLCLIRHLRWLEALHLDRLWLVVNGLMEAMRILFWLSFVVVCFLYVCAVLMTQP